MTVSGPRQFATSAWRQAQTKDSLHVVKFLDTLNLVREVKESCMLTSAPSGSGLWRQPYRDAAGAGFLESPFLCPLVFFSFCTSALGFVFSLFLVSGGG